MSARHRSIRYRWVWVSLGALVLSAGCSHKVPTATERGDPGLCRCEGGFESGPEGGDRVGAVFLLWRERLMEKFLPA